MHLQCNSEFSVDPVFLYSKSRACIILQKFTAEKQARYGIKIIYTLSEGRCSKQD